MWTAWAVTNRAASGVEPATASVGPSRSAKPSRLRHALQRQRDAGGGAITAADEDQRSLRPRGGGSGRSRIARMMFSRLTRRLVTTIVTSATTNPIANDAREAARLQREEEVEAVVLGGEDASGDGDENRAEPDADQHAERRRDERVEPALGGEGADELRAAHPDRARHPELGLALGGEHHEQVDEQQEPGEDAEAPHRREHRR